MIKPFNCVFSHVWCNQYSLAVNSLPCKTQKPLVTSGRRRLNRRRKHTWRACLSVTRTFMPTKPLQYIYTVTITHLVCDSHLSQLPQQEFQLPWNKQCMLEVDTCRMTACRRGLLPHWHIACHCWMQLSAWEPSRWTSQTVYKLHFCFNDSCFTSNQFNDDVQKAIFNRNCLASQKDECSISTEANCWH